jgi:ascorbate-specific PTS system EIIC-type component UlaA
MKLILLLLVGPPLLFFLGQAIGFIPSGEAGYGAATLVAGLQGIILMPVLVFHVYRAVKEPSKYFAPKSPSIIDHALLGLLLLVVAVGLARCHGH